MAVEYGGRAPFVYERALPGFSFEGSAGDAGRLAGDPKVRTVVPDRRVRTTAQSVPTGVRRIDGPLSGTAAGDGAGRVDADIAVIDTGIDLDHEDLAGKVTAHVSCVGAGDDPSRCGGSGNDEHGHGTHVAGIAAAITGNGKGMAGMAPGAGLMAVKVLRPDGTGSARGTIADIRGGIRWAVDNGAHVINLSLGEDIELGGLLGNGLASAIEYAWERGSIPVVAAGNNSVTLFGSSYSRLPVVVVTATDRNDEQAPYASNVRNARWGMAAPGGAGTAAEAWGGRGGVRLGADGDDAHSARQGGPRCVDRCAADRMEAARGQKCCDTIARTQAWFASTFDVGAAEMNGGSSFAPEASIHPGTWPRVALRRSLPVTCG